MRAEDLASIQTTVKKAKARAAAAAETLSKVKEGDEAGLEAAQKAVAAAEAAAEAEDEAANAEEKQDPPNLLRVPGTPISILERLSDEYGKALRGIASYSGEYIARLQDEHKLLQAAALVQQFYERFAMPTEAAQVREKERGES